ncbi:MAG: hypothetical protein GX431_08425 [Bacteroidales bacterium]|mgnify:CR=1 FL=1|jgi:hypothetical protein|nr:hypothetical protein [Bacteroidales bacterium]
MLGLRDEETWRRLDVKFFDPEAMALDTSSCKPHTSNLKHVCGFVNQEFLYFFIGHSRDKKFHRFGIIDVLMKSQLLP